MRTRAEIARKRKDEGEKNRIEAESSEGSGGAMYG